jgi:multisubunit Na+/H+ antiporter MnhB subunit
LSRAPRLEAIVYALAVAIIIALAGPLLLFNPWFVSFEQQRNDVALALGVNQAAVDEVTGTILLDLYTHGDFDVSLDGHRPLLDAMERSHMGDVSGLVRILGVVLGAAVVLFALSRARLRDPRRRGRLLVVAAAAVGAIAIALAIVFAVAFEPAFLAFHRLFFSEGTYLFGPDSNLIRLFPEGFWFESSLVAGATIVLAALLVGLLGWRLRREPGS